LKDLLGVVIGLKQCVNESRDCFLASLVGQCIRHARSAAL